jgi:hypothetical protein
MSQKRRTFAKFPWTADQDAALRGIWHSGKRIKENMHLFGQHSYGSVITRAWDLRLGKRTNCPRGASPASPRIILRLLADRGPLDRFTAAVLLGIDESNAHKHMKAMHLAGMLHIVDWKRRTTSSRYVPVFAAGAGVDAPKPPRLTSAEKESRRRAVRKQATVAHPFAVAMNQIMREAA